MAGSHIALCKERSCVNQKNSLQQGKVGKDTPEEGRAGGKGLSLEKRGRGSQTSLELSCCELVWKWEKSRNKGR